MTGRFLELVLGIHLRYLEKLLDGSPMDSLGLVYANEFAKVLYARVTTFLLAIVVLIVMLFLR